VTGNGARNNVVNILDKARYVGRVLEINGATYHIVK